MIIRLAERKLMTRFGTFTEILYYGGRKESIAIVMGEDNGGEEVLCRVHSHCIGAHVFNSIECTCREEMEAAQSMIQAKGRGIIIWLDQEGKGNGHLALMQSIRFKKEFGQAEAYVKAGYKADNRSYRVAAQILSDLGVRSIIVLANDSEKANCLENDSVVVAGTQRLDVRKDLQN